MARKLKLWYVQMIRWKPKREVRWLKLYEGQPYVEWALDLARATPVSREKALYHRCMGEASATMKQFGHWKSKFRITKQATADRHAVEMELSG